MAKLTYWTLLFMKLNHNLTSVQNYVDKWFIYKLIKCNILRMTTYWGYTLVNNRVRNTVPVGRFCKLEDRSIGRTLEKSIILFGHSHSFANLNASLLSSVIVSNIGWIQDVNNFLFADAETNQNKSQSSSCA
jgi:hypothetical protein